MPKHMDNMEFLEAVTIHLLKQNKKAMRKYKSGVIECAYRGDNNTSCAIGCMIPDELYTPEMEEMDVLGLRAMYPKVHPYLGSKQLCVNLQSIHDGYKVTQWPELLALVKADVLEERYPNKS